MTRAIAVRPASALTFLNQLNCSSADTGLGSGDMHKPSAWRSSSALPLRRSRWRRFLWHFGGGRTSRLRLHLPHLFTVSS